LVEKITRNKIYASVYWKKECFGLSAEALVDKAVQLRYVGGMVGEPQKPTEFICLILKMLQIQPDKEIIIEFIKNDDYKYVRLLGELLLHTAVTLVSPSLATFLHTAAQSNSTGQQQQPAAAALAAVPAVEQFNQQQQHWQQYQQ
jgi:hypothetical protein